MAQLDGDEYLTAEEACAVLGVKPATLYAYVSRGVLSSFRQGIRRRRLYRRKEVEALVTLKPGSSSGATQRELPRAEDWIPFVN